MKKILFLSIGIILIVYSVLKGGRYITQYNTLTEYGKGYVWGAVILFVIGIIFVLLTFRRKRKSDIDK